MTYRLVNKQADRYYDVTNLVQSIRWGGDVRQAARKLTVNLVYSRDGNQPRFKPGLASWFMLENDGKEIIRAVVFNNEIDASGSLTVEAYTHAIYLLKSKRSMTFRNTSAEQVIRKVCEIHGIRIGSLPNTGVVLKKLICRNKTLYDICTEALAEASKRNGKKYQIRFYEGALHVIERGAQTVRWRIEQGSNLINARYSESIEEMKNRILIVGKDNKIIADVKNEELIRQYGLLQELQQENDATPGEAKTIAENLLKELGRVFWSADVECIGIDDVEAGDVIEIQDSLTGLIGTFVIDEDDHTVENGRHTMRLKLDAV